MENAKKTINLFLKNKYNSVNELKAELYKAGVPGKVNCSTPPGRLAY